MPRKRKATALAPIPKTESPPYLRVLPLDLEVDPDPLRLRLDFHEETLLLYEYGGHATTTRVVSALDVAHALAQELDMHTGILPAETLWFVKTATGARTAVWRGPRVWSVQLREDYNAPARKFRLPMPGLVFVCNQAAQAPYVFAAKARPKSMEDQLYHCPAFNVFANGGVCHGSHTFPKDASRIPEDFFRSFFSVAGQTRGRSRSMPEDLLGFWTSLHKQPTFPLDELMPILAVADAIRIGS